MHPILFQIGKLPIHSYGFMLALSFLIGIWWGGLRAKRRGLDGNVISDVGFWIILAAIVGARLYYVILHFDEFEGQLLSIINPFHGGAMGIGGLVMYGGYIGALLASVVYFRLNKLSMLAYGDAVAPTIGLGIFLTRIGCFLNGCCFGAATTSPVGVHFPALSPAGQYQLSIHARALFPSQLFESVGGLVIAGIIVLIGRKKICTGFEFFMTGLLYSVLRFIVDYTRYYTPGEHILGLTHNQVACIGIFVIFGGLLLKNCISDTLPQPDAAVPPSPAADSGAPKNAGGTSAPNA